MGWLNRISLVFRPKKRAEIAKQRAHNVMLSGKIDQLIRHIDSMIQDLRTLPQPTIGEHDESEHTDGRRIVSRSGDR